MKSAMFLSPVNRQLYQKCWNLLIYFFLFLRLLSINIIFSFFSCEKLKFKGFPTFFTKKIDFNIVDLCSFPLMQQKENFDTCHFDWNLEILIGIWNVAEVIRMQLSELHMSYAKMKRKMVWYISKHDIHHTCYVIQ